jgi:hypothetical protein
VWRTCGSVEGQCVTRGPQEQYDSRENITVPIDPSIPLGVKPMQIDSPLQVLGNLSKLRTLQDEAADQHLTLEKHQRETAEDQMMTAIWQHHQGDPEKAMPEIRQRVSPERWARFEKALNDERRSAVEKLKSDVELAGQQFEHGTRLLQSVTDQATYQAVLPQIAKMSPEIAEALGPQYDPQRVQQWIHVGTTTKELTDQRREALEAFGKGDLTRAAGTWLSTVQTPDEWSGAINDMRRLGVPSQVLQQFGTFSPEARQRAGILANQAMDPKQRTEELAYERQLLGGTTSQEEWNAVLAELPAHRRGRYPKQFIPAMVRTLAAQGRQGASGGAGSDYSRFLERWAADRQTTPQALTSAQELAARRAFGDANRAPQRAAGAARGRATEDPKLPPGVEDYLVKLKNRGDTREQVTKEVFSTWGTLRRDHPQLSPERVQQAIARLFPDDLLGGGFVPGGSQTSATGIGAGGEPAGPPQRPQQQTGGRGRGSGPGTGSPAAAAPTGTRTATRAQAQSAADSLHMPYETYIQELKKRGVTVTD